MSILNQINDIDDLDIEGVFSAPSESDEAVKPVSYKPWHKPRKQ